MRILWVISGLSADRVWEGDTMFVHRLALKEYAFRCACSSTHEVDEQLMLTMCVWCSLDTGRLNPETYRLFNTVEKHYGIRIEYTFPDAQETMDFVREKGMFSFYEDGHQECCRVRKVLGSDPPCSSKTLASPS